MSYLSPVPQQPPTVPVDPNAPVDDLNLAVQLQGIAANVTSQREDEWRDVRIVGTYLPVGSNNWVTVDRAYRVAGTVDQYGVTKDVTGTNSEQDVTPTYTQAQAGESGFNVVSPIATDAFASGIGTHGLEESSDQPGDLTRLFYGTADGSRAHHFTVQRTGPYASALGPGVVGWTGGPGPLAGTGIVGLSEIGNGGTGVIVQDSAAPTFAYYQFNRLTGNFEWVCAAWDPRQNPLGGVAGAPAAVVAAANVVRYRQTAGRLWLGKVGIAGLWDLFTPATTVATDLPVIGYGFLGDRLHIFSYSNRTVVLNSFDLDVNGNLIRTTNSLGTPVVGYIKNAGQPFGMCVTAGYLIITTERGIYAVSFSDINRAYTSTLIDEVPTNITGPPVAWMGDVWVPCGNRVFRFTIGRIGNTYMPVDIHGTLPAPYDGDIVQLFQTPDRLVGRIVKDTTHAALITLDGGGSVATLRWSDQYDNAVTGLSEVARQTVIPIVGYGEPLVAIPRGTSFAGVGVADTVVVPNGTRNPARQPALNRQQIGQGVALWPFQYGVNRHAPKTAARIGVEVEGVGAGSSGLTVAVYIQRDRENATVAQSFFGGPLDGTGTWHQVASVALESFGIGRVSGTGIFWAELNEQGDYLVCKNRYRLCAVITGDPTGVRFPELRSLIVQRYEWVNKGFLSTLRLRIQQWDDTAAPGEAALFGEYETVRDVAAAVEDLRALVTHDCICTFYPLGAQAQLIQPFRGVITKFNRDPMHMSTEGITHEVVTLSVSHVVPSGLYSEVY